MSLRQRSKATTSSSGASAAPTTQYQSLLPPAPPGKTVCPVCGDFGNDASWLVRHRLSCKEPPADMQKPGGKGGGGPKKMMMMGGPKIGGPNLLGLNNNTRSDSSMYAATANNNSSMTSDAAPLQWTVLRDQGNTAVADPVAEEVQVIKMSYEDIVTVENDNTTDEGAGAAGEELPILTFTLEAPTLSTDDMGVSSVSAAGPSKTFLLRISLVQGYPYTGPNVAWTVLEDGTSGPQLPMSQQKKVQRFVAETVKQGAENGQGCIQDLVMGVTGILNGEDSGGLFGEPDVMHSPQQPLNHHLGEGPTSGPGTPMMLPRAAPGTPQMHPQSNPPEATGMFPPQPQQQGQAGGVVTTGGADHLTLRKTQLLLLHLVDKVTALQFQLDESNNKLAELLLLAQAADGSSTTKATIPSPVVTTPPQLLFDTISEHLVKDLNLLSGELRSEFSRAMVRRYFKQYYEAELGARLRFLWSSPSSALGSELGHPTGGGDGTGTGSGNDKKNGAQDGGADGAAADSTSRYQQEFEQVDKLGEGGFASVFSARKRVDGRLYAVKRLAMRRKHSSRTLREVKTLAKFQHPNIVRFYDAWVEAGNHCGEVPTDEDEEEEETDDEESYSEEESHPYYQGAQDSSDGDDGGDEQNRAARPNQGGGFRFGDVDSDSNEDDSDDDSSSSGGGDEFFFSRGGKQRKPSTADSEDMQREGTSASTTDSDELSDPSTTTAVAKGKGTKHKDPAANNKEGEDASPGWKGRGADGKSHNKSRTATTDSLFGGRGDDKEIQTLYITMEHCDTKTLKDAIDEGCFVGQSDTMNSIFRQLLSALAYLHKQGVVHRDMKPANVLFAQHATDYSDVKIADFGLARIVDADEMAPRKNKSQDKSSSSKPHLSVPTTTITESCGTALYAAPEQLTDNYGVLVDEYALGLLLYEMWLSALGKDYRERLALLERLRKDEHLPPWFWEVGDKMIPSIIARLTRKDVTKRASCEEILNLAELPGEPAAIIGALEVVSDHGVRMARRLMARLKMATLASHNEVDGMDGFGFTPSTVYGDDPIAAAAAANANTNNSFGTSPYSRAAAAFQAATAPLPTPPQFLSFITEVVTRVATTHNAEMLTVMSPVLPIADYYYSSGSVSPASASSSALSTPVIFTEEGEGYSVPKYPCTLIAYHYARCPFYWESCKDAVIRFQHHGCEVVPSLHGSMSTSKSSSSSSSAAAAAASSRSASTSLFTFGVVSQGAVSSLLDIQRDIEVLCYILELIHCLKSKEGGVYEIQFSHMTLQNRFKLFNGGGVTPHASPPPQGGATQHQQQPFGTSAGSITLDAMGGGSGGDDQSMDRRIDECLTKFCPGLRQLAAQQQQQQSSTSHGAAALVEVQVAVFTLKRLIESIILSPQFQSQCPAVNLSLCSQTGQTAPLVEGPMWRVVFHQPATGKKAAAAAAAQSSGGVSSGFTPCVSTVLARGGRLDNLAASSRGLIVDPKGSFVTWDTTQVAKCVKGRRTTSYPDLRGVLMSMHGMKRGTTASGQDDLTCPLHLIVARGGISTSGYDDGGNYGGSSGGYDHTGSEVTTLTAATAVHAGGGSALLDVEGGPVKDKLLEAAMHLWADGVRAELQRNPRSSPALRCTKEFGFCVEVQLQRDGLKMLHLKSGTQSKAIDVTTESLVQNVQEGIANSSGGGGGGGPGNAVGAGGTGLVSMHGGVPATIRVRFLGRDQPGAVQLARDSYKAAMLDGFPNSVLVVDASLVDIRNCMTEFIGGVATAGAKGSSVPPLLEWLKRHSGGSALTSVYSTVDKAVELIVAGNALKGAARAGGKGSRYAGKKVDTKKKGGGGIVD